MRNLLGRLHARSVEELARIAVAWHVPLPSGDRLTLVSRLYRALSDPRTVRDCWARLPEDERAMVRLLAVSDETAMPLRELAQHLGLSEDAAREIAVRLYHKVIVAREGDDEGLETALTGRTSAWTGLLSGTVSRWLRRLVRVAFVLTLSAPVPSSDVAPSIADVAPVEGAGEVARDPDGSSTSW